MAGLVSRKIAIVDDDRAVCDSLRFLLDVMGYPVETFPSAEAFLAGHDPHVDHLVLDHHMPQMTGLQLAERLRADNVALPILLITGSPSPEIVARATQLGVRVTEKPPSEQELLEFLDGA